MSDDTMVERGAKAVHQLSGSGSWADLLPARKQSYRASARVLLEYIDRSIEALDRAIPEDRG